MIKSKYPYLITALALLADLFVVALLSLIQLKFDFAEIKKPIFWINIGLTQLLIMTAYYALTYLGKNNAEKLEDVVELEKLVNKNFEQIDNNFLAKDLEEFIEIENLRFKHEAYINFINNKISQTKDPKERTKLIEEKNKCIEWKIYYDHLNYPDGENKKPDNDFDVTLKKVKSQYINYRQFVSGFSIKTTAEIASYNASKVLFKDSANKIVLSIFSTCLFSSVVLGSLKSGWQGVYDVMWRTFLIALNSLLGYFEGHKLITVYKKDALMSKKKIQADFFNKMFTLGKIKKSGS